MELWRAIKEYNNNHKSHITYSYIAASLGITRQAFNYMVMGGSLNHRKALLKHKDRMKEILPDELYNNITFPESGKKMPVIDYKRYKNNDKVSFKVDELSRLNKVKWCISKSMYKKIIEGKLVTPYMHDKVMVKVKEAEDYIKPKLEARLDSLFD